MPEQDDPTRQAERGLSQWLPWGSERLNVTFEPE